VNEGGSLRGRSAWGTNTVIETASTRLPPSTRTEPRSNGALMCMRAVEERARECLAVRSTSGSRCPTDELFVWGQRSTSLRAVAQN
jgi:hypothetical protein